MSDKPIKFWTVVYASADRSDIGAGCTVFWTEEEAHNDIRSALVDDVKGRWDDGEYPTQAAADAAFAAEIDKINKMTYAELQSAYDDIAEGGDWLQVVYVEEKELPVQPDLSTPADVEKFLEA